jgi:N-acetylmuramic acid 6-phosphate etherase
MSEEQPTEAILEAARNLDRLSVEEAVALIHAEDGNAYAAVGRVLPEISRAVDILVCAIGGGGRWFNVGAGTSGRLGVLDASEVPPTFGMSPQIVQGVIAGGDRALRHSVEGAEDDREACAWELRERGLTIGDAVVAISASGRTPFTLRAVEEAHAVGARSVAITCDASSELAEAAEVSISLEVGPEVVAGSTRMKGGLAQKMVLHTLSTAVMVQLGRVEGNLMTRLSPVNGKLQTRAARILMSLAGVDIERARELLARHDSDVAAALREAREPTLEG